MAHLLLYDGQCGLCHGAVQFVLARDRAARFRFASLQGTVGQRVLSRLGRDPAALDTVVLVADFEGPGERVLEKGVAAVFTLDALGGGWRAARVGGLLPRVLLDALYDGVARRRFRWFGRRDACVVPGPGERERFLE